MTNSGAIATTYVTREGSDEILAFVSRKDSFFDAKACVSERSR
jgi:hypothetical protein